MDYGAHARELARQRENDLLSAAIPNGGIRNSINPFRGLYKRKKTQDNKTQDARQEKRAQRFLIGKQASSL